MYVLGKYFPKKVSHFSPFYHSCAPVFYMFSTSHSLFFFSLPHVSVQVRCLGTTTPPLSPAVRWWTLAGMSSSSMSARRLLAVTGRGRTMRSGDLSRKRPMRRLHFSKAAWGHKGTPFAKAPYKMIHCLSREWWRSGRWESKKWPMAVYYILFWSPRGN